MAPETVTLVVTLAGITATAITGGLGLYFTARGRTAPLREHLYSRQVDVAVEVIGQLGRIRNSGAILVSAEASHFHAQARDDLSEAIAAFSEACEVAAAIMPVKLYVEIAKLRTLIVDFTSTLDEGGNTDAFPKDLAGRAAKVALMCRTFLGVEELADEGAKLLAVHKDFQQLVALDPRAITRSIDAPEKAARRVGRPAGNDR